MKDVYIITGATGGMGIDTAKKFKEKGQLILCDLDEEKLNALKEELGDVSVLKCDITKDEDINKLKVLASTMGPLKGVIHYAGVAGEFGDADKVMEINLIGTAKLMEALYDLLAEGSVFINTSSMAAYMAPTIPEMTPLLSNPLEDGFLDKIKMFTNGSPDAAYSFSKQGVILITKNNAGKFGAKKARLISVSPGTIETPMLERQIEVNGDAINGLIGAAPVGRVGYPEDITNLVEFLCSDKASFITGMDILIDGGVTSVFSQMKKGE